MERANPSPRGRVHRRFLVSQTCSTPERLEWRDDVDLIDERAWVDRLAARFPSSLIPAGYTMAQLLFACKMLWFARDYEAAAVGRYGNYYILLASLLGLRRATVLTDVERHVGLSLVDRRVAKAASRIGCFTRDEISSFAAQCGVAESKFSFLPYYTQPRDLRSRISDSGYILSAGRNARDWPTLLRAVDGLPYPVQILSQHRFENLPSNCTVRYVSSREYFDVMAGASCVAVALERETYRVTGMITFVTAMAMGKPVILAGPAAGNDYIKHDVTGFCHDYGDSKAMRDSLCAVMNDPALRHRMGRAASEHAQREFSPAAYQIRVLKLLEAAAAEYDADVGIHA